MRGMRDWSLVAQSIPFQKPNLLLITAKDPPHPHRNTLGPRMWSPTHTTMQI